MRLEKEKRLIYKYLIGGLILGSGSALYAIRRYRRYLQEYKAACLYIAVMDDEICRNELEGRMMSGRKLEFPCKQESLSYRYELFLDMYKGMRIRSLREKIEEFEQRLEESREEYRRFLQEQREENEE